MLSLFVMLPVILAIVLISVLVLVKKIQYSSPLVWVCIITKVVPARAHLVLDYNKQVDDEELSEDELGRKVRRQQLKVNCGYLRGEPNNTALFLQALRFEELKIKESKRGPKYAPQETP